MNSIIKNIKNLVHDKKSKNKIVKGIKQFVNKNNKKKKKKKKNIFLIVLSSLAIIIFLPIIVGLLALMFEDDINKFIEDSKIFEPKQ